VGATVGSIAVIQRSPLDAVYSAVTGRDCSIVRTRAIAVPAARGQRWPSRADAGTRGQSYTSLAGFLTEPV
jgi:hypothetical protein